MTESTNDGSDHSYRMIVEDRYKNMAQSRKIIKKTAVAQLIYILVRSAWKSLPSLMLDNASLHVVDIGIFLAAVALFFVYRFAFGFGKPQNEKQWAIVVYTVGSMFVLAECFLTFWSYHVLYGPQSTDAHMAAQYPFVPRMVTATLDRSMGLAPAIVLPVLDVFEKGIDVVGIFAMALSVYFSRDYMMEKKAARKEADERRAAATKAE